MSQLKNYVFNNSQLDRVSRKEKPFDFSKSVKSTVRLPADHRFIKFKPEYSNLTSNCLFEGQSEIENMMNSEWSFAAQNISLYSTSSNDEFIVWTR